MKKTIMLFIILFLIAGCTAAGTPENDRAAATAVPHNALSTVPPTTMIIETTPKTEPTSAPTATSVEDRQSYGPTAVPPMEQAEPAVIDLSQLTPQPAVVPEIIELAAPGLPNPMPWLIQQVKIDLGARLGIDISQIELVETREVTWPDSGLGCPPAGITVTAVETPGHQIILTAQGQRFHYHTRGFEAFILCADSDNSSP